MLELLDDHNLSDIKEVPQFETYTIYYDGIASPKLTHDIPGSFLANKKGFKLYVVTSPEAVLYVGITKTSFTSRLRLGHLRTTQPSKGYHGYKWLRETHPRTMHLYLLSLDTLLLQAPPGCSHEELAERLESELVFAIRAVTGSWPVGQHEIHFHNLAEYPKLARYTTKLAQQLLLQLPLKSS